MASVPMLLEYEAVLMRPAQRQVIGFTRQDVERFLDGLVALLEPVTPHLARVERATWQTAALPLRPADGTSAPAAPAYLPTTTRPV